MQTIYQKLEQEFIKTRQEEFRQKGKQAVALNLFRSGIDFELVEKSSELPRSTLEALQEKLRKAGTETKH